jgi:hypothetical protein
VTRQTPAHRKTPGPVGAADPPPRADRDQARISSARRGPTATSIITFASNGIVANDT